MHTNEKTFIASDGKKIFYREFLPDDGNVDYIIQVAHSMGEHSGRYFSFAEFFTARNIAVYICDLRGNGKTIENIDELGVWQDTNSWFTIVGDLKQLNDIANEKFPDKKIFLFGHGVGSYLVPTYLIKYKSDISAAIITGSGFSSKVKLKLGYYYSKLTAFLRGNKYKSGFFNRAILDSYNKSFESPYCWLTRDKCVVNEFVEDPLCGHDFAVSFYRSLFVGILYASKSSNLKKISANMPILFMSGANDPVGDFGNDVFRIANYYQKAGLNNIDVKLYESARHEVFNETNKKKILQDIYLWLTKL